MRLYLLMLSCTAIACGDAQPGLSGDSLPAANYDVYTGEQSGIPFSGDLALSVPKDAVRVHVELCYPPEFDDQTLAGACLPAVYQRRAGGDSAEDELVVPVPVVETDRTAMVRVSWFTLSDRESEDSSED